MKYALDFEIELLFEFKEIGERLCRFADSTFPLGDARIGLRDPSHVFLPFACIGEQMRQVPFVGLGNLSAR